MNYWLNHQTRARLSEACSVHRQQRWQHEELPMILTEADLKSGDIENLMKRLGNAPKDNRRDIQRLRQYLTRLVFEQVGKEVGEQLYPLVEARLLPKMKEYYGLYDLDVD